MFIKENTGEQILIGKDRELIELISNCINEMGVMKDEIINLNSKINKLENKLRINSCEAIKSEFKSDENFKILSNGINNNDKRLKLIENEVVHHVDILNNYKAAIDQLQSTIRPLKQEKKYIPYPEPHYTKKPCGNYSEVTIDSRLNEDEQYDSE